MFAPDSRYADLESAEYSLVSAGGVRRVVRYVRRRFLPTAADHVELARHNVTGTDRLDNISARYLGDPLQFWRICDANPVLQPTELTERVGATIRVPLVIR